MELENGNGTNDKLLKPKFVKSCGDLVLTSDRVLVNLLLSECHNIHPNGVYMQDVQEYLAPRHR